MSPEDAYELLEAIAIISGTKDKLKKIKTASEAKQKIKKPAIDFSKCGIPVGAKLVFVEDQSIVAVVASKRKVLYNNEETSVSAIASEIKGYSVAGQHYFTYNGRLLVDIANETQWKDYN
ncbi:MAG: hypothetical protein J6330_07830 [Clostridia bacterium]|nr:hypothetical protein [Clostridia bacterium]